MHYDPVKLRLARLLKTPALRRLFHVALDLLFLRAWYVRRELKRIAASESFNPKPKTQNPKLLDAGMGFGQYSDRLCRMFPDARVVGLEIDRAHLYGCESYFPEVHRQSRIVIGDVQRLPLEVNSFDLILTVDVMEHIPDDRATFAEYARVLKAGGLLVMHTPRRRDEGEGMRDEDGGIRERKRDEGGKGWNVGEHVRDGYSDEEAREKLAAAGLSVQKIVRGYGTPGMIGWTLLQRVPMTMLGWSVALMPVVVLYLIIALLPGLLFLWLDYIGGGHPNGGSLLVVAQKK